MRSIPGRSRGHGSAGSIPTPAHESPAVLRHTTGVGSQDLGSCFRMESIRFHDSDPSVRDSGCSFPTAVPLGIQYRLVLVPLHDRHLSCRLHDHRSRPSSSPAVHVVARDAASVRSLRSVVHQTELWFSATARLVHSPESPVLRRVWSPSVHGSDVLCIRTSVLFDARLHSQSHSHWTRTVVQQFGQALQAVGRRTGLLVTGSSLECNLMEGESLQSRVLDSLSTLSLLVHIEERNQRVFVTSVQKGQESEALTIHETTIDMHTICYFCYLCPMTRFRAYFAEVMQSIPNWGELNKFQTLVSKS